MKLTIEVELPIELSKDKKTFIVHRNSAFNQLVGTSAGSGNPHIYNAKKVKSKNIWHLPVEEVEKRSKELKMKVNDIIDKITFIDSVLEMTK